MKAAQMSYRMRNTERQLEGCFFDGEFNEGTWMSMSSKLMGNADVAMAVVGGGTHPFQYTSQGI